MFALGKIGGVGFPSYNIPLLHLGGKTIGASILFIAGLFFEPTTLSNQGYFKDETMKFFIYQPKNILCHPKWEAWMKLNASKPFLLLMLCIQKEPFKSLFFVVAEVTW